MRKIYKKSGFIFLLINEFFLLGISLIFFFQIFFNCFPIYTKEQEDSSEEKITIYLKTDHIHTDLVFPMHSEVINWDQYFSKKFFQDTVNQYPYIAFGWGNLDFFVNTPEWSDLSFRTAFNAVAYIGKSAMHVQKIQMPYDGFEDVKFEITKSQYETLINYVKNSLNRKPADDWIEGKYYWEYDAFFESKHKYGLLYNCNTWINSALKEAKLPAVIWTVTADGIIEKYQR